MSIFDNYLPWTKLGLDSNKKVDLNLFFLPATNVTQDQRIPITNLMTVLYPIVREAIDLSKPQNRLAIVHWYVSIGKKTFRIEELESLINNKDPEADIKLKRGGVNLIGYARSMSGLGDDIRGLITVLERLNMPYSVVCLGHQSDHLIYGDVPNEILTPVYASSIFCMNAFEFCKLSQIYENICDSYGYIVLQAPWELPRLVAEWTLTLQVVDKIWAISRFVESAFKHAGFENVVYNPPIVKVSIPKVSNRAPPVRQKKPFTFLYIFDSASHLSRKNPKAAVQCFQKAFQSDENVRLTLKVSNDSGNTEFAELESRCMSDKRIKIERKAFTPKQIVELISKCDCYLSLHRSEGFGRTIAQASLLSKPVISTNWSGSIDILPGNHLLSVPYILVDVKESEYPGFKGQQWAEPDTQVATDKLRNIYFASAALRLKIGLENQTFAQNHFTVNANVEHYREQFKKIIK